MAALRRQGSVVKSLFDVKGARNLQSDLQQDAMAFAEYDMDGNQKLDFEEFYAMLPRLMRERFTPSEIQQLFKAADANGDGEVSVNEFLCVKADSNPLPSPWRSI